MNTKKPGLDAKLDFKCSEEVRGFSVTTNKSFDFFGTELEVLGPDGTPQQQSATIQCAGPVPGPGFGCGVTNRNTPTNCEALSGAAPGPQNVGAPCTNRVDAEDTAEVEIGFPVNPCKPVGPYAPGKDKLRVWLSVLTEPVVGSFNSGFTNQNQTSYTRGAYVSEPFRLKIVKYSNCTAPNAGEAKGKGKKSVISTGAEGLGARLW